MNKLVRDGKVAVLYSPAFGAGWYSWSNDCKECVFDPELVEVVLSGDRQAIIETAERLYGERFYTGGARDLEVEWLDVGAVFEIEEYDGSESIHVIGGREYLTA